MIPFHERLFSTIKKIPVVNQVKRLPFVKKMADSIRNRNMQQRRQLVGMHGYEILKSVCDISEKLEVPIWIDWGTLLGYHREGKILDHDYDLDVSTWRMDEALHSRFVGEMEKAGFMLARLFTLGDIIMTECYERDGVLIDVEYYWQEGDKAYTYSFDLNEQQTKVIQADGKQMIEGMNLYVFESDCTEFRWGAFSNGARCLVPVDAEKRVCEMYSENWRTPVKNYNWKDLHNYEEKGFVPEITGWRIK